VNQYSSITGSEAESGLGYDADGNMTQDGTWHYRYDGENRLVAMQPKSGSKTLVFSYDYLGRRVRKDVFESAQQAGLWGEYFYGTSLSGTPGAVELRSTVDFSSASSFPSPFSGGTGFSARWHGVVTPAQDGTWTFYTESDDGVRLWVDGKQLVNNWTDHGTTTDSGTIDLIAGRSYSIRMEFYQNGGGATAKLKWSGPGVSTPTIIPSSALRAPNASTLFVYSGWSLTAELDGKSAGRTLSKSYLWGVDFSNASGAAGGAGALLAVYQNSAWYHTAYDAMGNLTGYLDTSGNVAASYEFNAYGQIIASGGSATSFAFGFATQYTDHESGLVYYGMRFYQPKHGRFINRDPIEEAGGLNLYSFTGNSPSNRWDVLGLECRWVLDEPPITALNDLLGNWGSSQSGRLPKGHWEGEDCPFAAQTDPNVVVLPPFFTNTDRDTGWLVIDRHALDSTLASLNQAGGDQHFQSISIGNPQTWGNSGQVGPIVINIPAKLKWCEALKAHMESLKGNIREGLKDLGELGNQFGVAEMLNRAQLIGTGVAVTAGVTVGLYRAYTAGSSAVYQGWMQGGGAIVPRFLVPNGAGSYAQTAGRLAATASLSGAPEALLMNHELTTLASAVIPPAEAVFSPAGYAAKGIISMTDNASKSVSAAISGQQGYLARAIAMYDKECKYFEPP
jgi:RHS repeat-associated protein